LDRPCNCNRASKIDGKCEYNGEWKGSNGPASQRRQKANHKRHQIWLVRKPLRKSLQERNKTNKWW
jgi:hypothetical protein